MQTIVMSMQIDDCHRAEGTLSCRQESSQQGYTSQFPGHNFRTRRTPEPGHPVPLASDPGHATCYMCGFGRGLSFTTIPFISKMSTYLILWILWACALAFECK